MRQLSALRVLFFSSLSLLLLSIVVSSSVNASKCTFVSQRIQCGALTCDVATGMCIPCTNSSQCHESAMECRWNDETARDECMLMPVKELAADNLGGLIGSTIIAVATCSIAVLGGAGGGAILVGLFQILMGVPLVVAVALSQATIVGMAFFNVMVQVRRHHPLFQPPGPTRPAINFVLLFFWLPISLAGCMWGNLAGKVVPDWFRLALMFVLLSYILQRMFKKVFAQRKADKEKADKARQPLLEGENQNNNTAAVAVARDIEEDEEEEHGNDGKQTGRSNNGSSSAYIDSSRFLAGSQSENNINRSSVNYGATSSEDAGSLQSHSQALTDDSAKKPVAKSRKFNNNSTNPEDHEDHVDQHPIRIYILIVLVVGPMIVANLAKNRWVKCSDDIKGYWLVNGAATFYCLIIFFFFRHHLVKTREAIELGEEKASAIPFVWNTKTSIIFPILSLTAGASASLFGLGGGLILSFLFLEAGLLPEEVSATSGVTTFIIALESLIQFVIQGQLRYDYCLVFFFCGAISTVLGQKVMMPEIKRRGWTFLIVASLTFIMTGSMIVLAAVGIYDTIYLLNNGGSIGFGQLCPSASSAKNHPDTQYDFLEQFSKFVF